ncbi:MAG: acyltransferase [Pirellulaceae bacterium]|nr:acyltransferase [Pirellulaceae bacterium]
MTRVESNPSNNIKSGVVHLRSLTGLRFVAAFAVFYSHLQYFLFPEVRQFPIGGPAVAFFFVLSGFILTYVYDGRLTAKKVPKFLFTRWARLWPLLFVSTCISLIFLNESPGTHPGGSNSISSLLAQFLMLHSWLPIGFWFVDFNSVSWSISTELFFYLFFPLLLLGRRKFFVWKLLIVFVVAFGFLMWMQNLVRANSAPQWLNEVAVVIAFPVMRLPEFGVGMATCMVMRRFNAPFASSPAPHLSRFLVDSLWELGAVVFLITLWLATMYSGFLHYLYVSEDFGRLYSTWLRVSGGIFVYPVLIYVFASRRGILGMLLASRLGVWLGEISFAFYLIHQIVIVELNYQVLNDLQFAVFSFLIALFSAALLHIVIEMPCRNALLAIFQRQNDWLSKLTAGFKRVAKSSFGMILVFGLTFLLGFLWLRPIADVNRTRCAEIVQSTPAHLRTLMFSEEAILRGVQFERVERGIRIRMAWLRDRSWSRKRFMHICDQDGKILGQAPLQEKLFARHDPNQQFVDEIVLPKRLVKNADYVALGFWSEELGCAKVLNDAAEMEGCRIKILEIRALPEIKRP